MRNFLKNTLAFTAAALLATSGIAYGQAGGSATVSGGLGTTENGSLATAPTNLEQKANEQAEANNTPAANKATPGINTAAPGAVTPGYTNRVMPGMVGYNSVNPMSTTMAPSYYYARSAGLPYATYNSSVYNNAGGAPMTYGATTAYPSTVMSPGYNATIQPQYRRRGLFGRRNRVFYRSTPYRYYYDTPYNGYSTYGTTGYYSGPGAVGYRGTYGYGSSYLTPSRYSYGSATYNTPGTYSYSNGAYHY